MKGRRLWLLFQIGFTVLLLSGCDKLDDSGDAISEILPGTWLFSYDLQSDEDPGLMFSYDQVIFTDDGNCVITYPGGQMDGTYRANGSVIRIDGIINGETHTMLWRVRSFARKKIVAEYDFELGRQHITAIVTLDRDV